MRSTVLRLLLAALSVVLVATPTASGHMTDAQSKKRDHVERQYTHLYYTVKHTHGKRVPGRNIRRNGVKVSKKAHSRKARTSELQRSVRTFKRWLAPPAAPIASSDRRPISGYVANDPRLSGGRYAIPEYIVQCESHGDYTARNPSGAYGAYQIMPGTARAYGCDLSTPGGQDQCAGRIYADAGSAPWSCG